ncbi:MAG TPA: hypothetical protein VGM02_13205 [Acidobacteriaceae bacterium]
MPSSVHDGRPAETSSPADARPAWHFGRYLLIVLLLTVLVVLLTFPLAASHTFLRISRRRLWHAAEYRFQQPPHQDCDVIIAGDSSGLIGVDPNVLQAGTGWKTCNIALPYDNTALAGTRVLDAWLANNHPPRFIVFHLSDNHLHRPIVNEDNGVIDGWLMVDENFPAGEKLRIFVSHPLNTLRFVTAVWKEFLTTKPILRPDWTGGTYRYDMQEQAAQRGWMPERGTFADVVCNWQASDLYIEPAYLIATTAKYTRDGTRAVIWPSPVRDCDARIAQYRKNAQTLDLPQVAVYNRALFFDAFHLNTEGAARNATALASYLLSLEAKH